MRKFIFLSFFIYDIVDFIVSSPLLKIPTIFFRGLGIMATQKCDICGRFMAYSKYSNQHYYENQTNFCHDKIINVISIRVENILGEGSVFYKTSLTGKLSALNNLVGVFDTHL
jgi:hypothetical protein